MKKILLSLLFGLLCAPLFSQIQLRQEIVELAVQADAIVQGTITEVKGGYVNLDIQKVVVGPEMKSAEVSRFRNTKMAKRWSKYVVGQQVLLFLKGTDGERYDIMGVNGEGEKLIFGEDIYLDSRGGAASGRYEYHTLSPELNIYAEKVPLEDFENALPGLRSCYQINYVERPNKFKEMELHAVATRKCDADVLEPLRMQSDAARQMVDKAEDLVN